MKKEIQRKIYLAIAMLVVLYMVFGLNSIKYSVCGLVIIVLCGLAGELN